MRWLQLLRRTQRRSRRRLRFEPLEDRRLMACLAVGVSLAGETPDNDSQCLALPVPPPELPPAINVGKVGGKFTLQVQVRDVRNAGETTAGVIALPVNISWDRGAIEFVGDPNASDQSNPIVTPLFPLQRGLQSHDVMENLQGLRGAALPAVSFGMEIGRNAEEPFSELMFESNVATTTPFTVRLAGSMSFADAAVLQRVVRASNTSDNFQDNITAQARLQIDPVIISGMKFDDLDNDGVKDANEPGLSGWTIQLIRDTNLGDPFDPTIDPVITTTTTAADGSYQLTVTGAGTYFVREVQQAGWQQTTPNPAAITTLGVDRTGVDFGNRVIETDNSLSGFVFADTNLNGIFDAGEDGLPNVTIQLRRAGSAGDPLATAVTGPDGWYHFEKLESGSYDVIELQPAGFVNASISRGLVFPPGAAQPSESLRGTTDGFNAFRGINLSGGGNAVDFNFGDNVVPTKRRFVASVDPFAETCSLLGLNCVTVRGTTGNDQIIFAPDTDVVRVTVNNQPPQEFARDTVNIVKIDALAGNDTVTLGGSSADDVAHFRSDACTIQIGSYRPGDYAVLAVNAERTVVNGGSGNDLAVFRDSAVDEVLTATNEPFIGPVTELESALNMNRFARAVAFERTRAVSVPRTGINDTDTATLNGLPVELVGKWLIGPQP